MFPLKYSQLPSLLLHPHLVQQELTSCPSLLGLESFVGFEALGAKISENSEANLCILRLELLHPPPSGQTQQHPVVTPVLLQSTLHTSAHVIFLKQTHHSVLKTP